MNKESKYSGQPAQTGQTAEMGQTVQTGQTDTKWLRRQFTHHTGITWTILPVILFLLTLELGHACKREYTVKYRHLMSRRSDRKGRQFDNSEPTCDLKDPRPKQSRTGWITVSTVYYTTLYTAQSSVQRGDTPIFDGIFLSRILITVRLYEIN